MGKIRAGVNNLKLAAFSLMFPLLRHNSLFNKGRLTVSQLLLQLSNACLKSDWNKMSQKHFISCLYVSVNSYGQYIVIDAPSVFSCTLMMVMRQLLGNLYLQCCITGTDVLVFSLELFNTLCQGLVSGTALIFLLLQPRCQVINVTLQSTRFMKENLHFLYVCVDFLNINVFVWHKWLTFVATPRALQACSSPLSSAPFATSWSLFLNVHWPVEHPVCGPREESKSKILKKKRRRHMNLRCFDFIPFPSVADSIFQLQLQTSQLSVSVLCWLSSEPLCPVMPSQSKRRCSLSDHQSPSFAQSVFSPKSDKGQRTHKNIV